MDGFKRIYADSAKAFGIIGSVKSLDGATKKKTITGGKIKKFLRRQARRRLAQQVIKVDE